MGPRMIFPECSNPPITSLDNIPTAGQAHAKSWLQLDFTQAITGIVQGPSISVVRGFALSSSLLASSASHHYLVPEPDCVLFPDRCNMNLSCDTGLPLAVMPNLIDGLRTRPVNQAFTNWGSTVVALADQIRRQQGDSCLI